MNGDAYSGGVVMNRESDCVVKFCVESRISFRNWRRLVLKLIIIINVKTTIK